LRGSRRRLSKASRGACRYLIAAAIADAKSPPKVGPDVDEMEVSGLAVAWQ